MTLVHKNSLTRVQLNIKISQKSFVRKKHHLVKLHENLSFAADRQNTQIFVIKHENYVVRKKIVKNTHKKLSKFMKTCRALKLIIIHIFEVPSEKIRQSRDSRAHMTLIRISSRLRFCPR
jgi:hypothetical protein